nr:glycerophosphoryl diester phosphodiesterase membrane domain-containing protein [Enterococcus sp. 9E7_DIV0242]OTP18833.1 hypothetical protein A5888_000647 [Enterococcus sp. 9E7_DIV0242]
MNKQLSEREKEKPTLRDLIKKCLPQLFIFEFVYKLLVVLVGIPMIQAFIELMLELNDKEIVFNEGILYFFTSWSGIIGSILLFGVVSVGIYFELSVVTLLVYYAWIGKNTDLEHVMKVSLTKLRQLKHIGTLGFGLYMLVILPIARVGIASSIFPHFVVPNFITGELQKTAMGNAAVLIFYGLIFCLAWLLIFSLPSFVLEKRNFFGAVKANGSIIRHQWKALAGIGILFLLIHFIGVYLPEVAQDYLFTIPVLDTVWDIFQFVAINPTTIFQLLLLLLKVLYPIVLYAWIVYIYLGTAPLVYIEEGRLPEVDEQLQKTYDHSIKVYGWLKRKLISLRAWLNQKVFYQKHHKKIKVITGIIVVWLFINSIGGAPQEEPIIIGHRG